MQRTEYGEYCLNVVKEYAENIEELAYRECGQGGIFADGIELETGRLIKWCFPDGKQVEISNLANQQNLLRVFVALTNLTGDSKYKNMAINAVSYNFERQHTCGLLQWGGHRFMDFQTLEIVGIQDKRGEVHELKNCFPFYELMYEVNKASTDNFINAFWNAHVYRWGTLEINRHGYYMEKGGRLWASVFENPPAFTTARGLSFLNAGNDLMYAAGQAFIHSQNKGALIWLIRMLRQYAKARDEKTCLGSYQFNMPEQSAVTSDDRDTASKYGDRGMRQLGIDFGERALEGKIILENQARTIYYHNAIMLLDLGQKTGSLGKELIEFVRTGMIAFAKYAYDRDRNVFRPLLSDGTVLEGYVLKKDGYYGSAGTSLRCYKADDEFFFAYVKTYIVTKDEELVNTILDIARGLGLGELGLLCGEETRINKECNCQSGLVLLALIELYKELKSDELLELAIHICNMIIQNGFYKKCFVSDMQKKYVQFDSIEPLAILTLCEILSSKEGCVPPYVSGNGYIHGKYKMQDGTVKSYTTHELYEEHV